MREALGDVWRLAADNGGIVVVPTNGIVKDDGTAVMGRGVALEAATRFPQLPSDLGSAIRAFGNRPTLWRTYRPLLMTMPTKHHWRDKADIALIEQSAREMVSILDQSAEMVWMPRPGCGYGGLRWEDVKPVLAPILDDRFIAVTK